MLFVFRCGHGTLLRRMSNGDFKRLYVGEWLSNSQSALGRQYFPDGIYNGDWENGLRAGFGIMWYKTTSSYMGEWKNDKYHGAGVFFDGMRYSCSRYVLLLSYHFEICV